jgi:hypothetical protein
LLTGLLPNGLRTGAGAGVYKVREQEKLEARKILKNGVEFHLPSVCFVGQVGMSDNPFASLDQFLISKGLDGILHIGKIQNDGRRSFCFIEKSSALRVKLFPSISTSSY